MDLSAKSVAEMIRALQPYDVHENSAVVSNLARCISREICNGFVELDAETIERQGRNKAFSGLLLSAKPSDLVFRNRNVCHAFDFMRDSLADIEEEVDLDCLNVREAAVVVRLRLICRGFKNFL